MQREVVLNPKYKYIGISSIDDISETKTEGMNKDNGNNEDNNNG